MTKYLINRILRSLVSVAIVVGIVMVLIYSCLDRNLIFKMDPTWSHTKSNARVTYEMRAWENYGYVDYVPYADWLKELLKSGEIDQETYDAVAKVANKAEQDSEQAAEYIAKFTEYYKSQGYEVERKDGDMKGKTKQYKEGGQPILYAYRDIPVTTRLINYLTGLITVDNIHTVQEDIENRGISFTLYDPAYGGEKFSPAIMGNGTHHKYLFYMDDNFPFIHQNLVTISLGTSYSVNKDIDVFTTMTQSQGSFEYSTVTYPAGNTAETADDLHSATYVAGSLATGTPHVQESFLDDYTNVRTTKSGLSKMGYSFSIGICSVMLSYLMAIPLGTVMALRKDKLIDQLGTLYIVFITAVPSLAYIFLFKAIGGNIGLPTTFDMENPTTLMYVLPVISLALPSIANLMKWLRRYMIDQMNSDYVKFARSGGLSEGEIFSKHILKNAIIPIVHGIPSSVIFAMTGAIITERVYVVPGAGNLLTEAINTFDNGVIVGVTLFYAVLTVVSVILGDILMSMMDPRISFTAKER
ncbi:MAG: ABC transporter permease subunit [Oscillospiraceae bacterium]|nr:ABC transporter permease subunit [Oscillospiraceae bacterium]